MCSTYGNSRIRWSNCECCLDPRICWIIPNNQPGYTAAKGGLINLTRELALEWARHGIRVNAIAPGYISTELTDEMIAGESGRKWIERNTPMRRPGEVNELDGAMLLLASDAGSYITGETIAIDGGWLAR